MIETFHQSMLEKPRRLLYLSSPQESVSDGGHVDSLRAIDSQEMGPPEIWIDW